MLTISSLNLNPVVQLVCQAYFFFFFYDDMYFCHALRNAGGKSNILLIIFSLLKQAFFNLYINVKLLKFCKKWHQIDCCSLFLCAVMSISSKFFTEKYKFYKIHCPADLQLWMPVIRNWKNINLNQWFQYQNSTSLTHSRRKWCTSDVFGSPCTHLKCIHQNFCHVKTPFFGQNQPFIWNFIEKIHTSKCQNMKIYVLL